MALVLLSAKAWGACSAETHLRQVQPLLMTLRVPHRGYRPVHVIPAQQPLSMLVTMTLCIAEGQVSSLRGLDESHKVAVVGGLSATCVRGAQAGLKEVGPRGRLLQGNWEGAEDTARSARKHKHLTLLGMRPGMSCNVKALLVATRYSGRKFAVLQKRSKGSTTSLYAKRGRLPL